MAHRDPWLDRLDALEHDVRRFIDDARAQSRPEPVDALADVLDEIRDDLLEQARQSRRSRLSRTPREFHRMLRPIAAAAERFLRSVSFVSAWNAAGLRLRLRPTCGAGTDVHGKLLNH